MNIKVRSPPWVYLKNIWSINLSQKLANRISLFPSHDCQKTDNICCTVFS